MKALIRVALGFALVVSASHCAGHAQSRSTGDDDANSAPSASVEVGLGTVRRERVEDELSAFGSVAGGRNAQAQLGFAESGRIATIPASIGERVSAGAALATLDLSPFEDDLAQSEAALAGARASAEKAAIAARPQQIAQTNAEGDAARAQRSLARSQLARERSLFALGVASAADVESARAASVSAESAVRVLDSQRSSESAPFAPDVALANASVAAARAAVDAARAKIGQATLRAPFAGIVVALAHSQGEIVDGATPVVTLVNASAPVFTAQFTPSDAARIAIGDEASISVDSHRSVVRARVIAIDPVQNPGARTIAVQLRMPGSGGLAFVPGAYGRASVDVGETSGLVVAASAILADPTTGAAHLFRKTSDRYEAVPVEVKRETDGRAWIVGASLREGDRVVTSGAYSLER